MQTYGHVPCEIFSRLRLNFASVGQFISKAADKHVPQLKIKLISHLHIWRLSLVLASSSLSPFLNFCVVHATTNESRENHAIDFPIVHTSFWKPRPVFCFWQETQVRNCWCHFHWSSMTDSATQKSVLVHYLPDNSLFSAFRKCFRNFTSTKQRSVFSPALSWKEYCQFIQTCKQYIYIYKMYFRFSSKGSPFTLL